MQAAKEWQRQFQLLTRGSPGTVTIPQYRFNKTKQHTQRAHVTFFLKRDKLELAFWLLCRMHAVIQVPPDGVVGQQPRL